MLNSDVRKGGEGEGREEERGEGERGGRQGEEGRGIRFDSVVWKETYNRDDEDQHPVHRSGHGCIPYPVHF